ncbi:NAD(P)-dependent oxidoreductase [Pelagibacterales bacterium SAG-MED12]|nr:NAD(P)-dependent oxidoreductase [Pelagibacterales bacterium SAG-MED12]
MILVTGSTGYIGFHICEMLELKKIPYFGIDNFSRSLSKNIINKKKFLKIDINSNNISSLLKSKKIHTIIHTAAFSFPPESENNKEIYYKNNILKTKKFIDNCSKGKIKRFIFLSSSNVYNFSLKSIKPAKESQKTNPENYYGKTKSIIEKYLKKKFKICIILRLFNIAGYSNKREFYEFKNKFRRIMPVLNEAIRKKIPLKINLVKRKNKLVYPARDFVHIQDFLNIILKTIKKNISGLSIINVGNGKLVYLDKIINIFEEKMSKKISYKKTLNSIGNYNYTLSNNLKLRKVLKYNFQFNLKDIIKSCIKKKII